MAKEAEIYTPFPLLLGINAEAQAAGRDLTFVSDQVALEGLARHAKSHTPRRVILGFSQDMAIQAPNGAMKIKEGDYMHQLDPPLSPDKDLVVTVTALDEEHITNRLATAMHQHPALGAHARRKTAYYRRLAVGTGLFAGATSTALAASQTGHSSIAAVCGLGMPLAIIGMGMNYIFSAGPTPPLRPIPADLTPPIRVRSKPL